MKKALFFILLLALSPMVNAQTFQNFKKKLTGDTTSAAQQPQQNTGSQNTGDGNQTIVNVERQDDNYEHLGPNAQSNMPKESKWNLDIDFLPYVMPQQESDRQFVTDTSSLGVGATYKFSDRVHMFVKWQQFKLNDKTFEEEIEVTKYDENGDIMYDENGDEQTETKIEEYKVGYSLKHILWGFGMRWNIGVDNNQQIQLNLGSTLFDEVEDTNSGEKVGDLDSAIVAEIKYLWVSDNSGFGIAATFVDISSKSISRGESIKGGQTTVSFTTQIGFPGFNAW